MSQKENIFKFNHIDKSKTKEELQEIKELYKYYHYKYWCHRQAFKHFKVAEHSFGSLKVYVIC